MSFDKLATNGMGGIVIPGLTGILSFLIGWRIDAPCPSRP